MTNKIIPFRDPIEDTYPDTIRELLTQHFPHNTWHRLQHDAETKLRARLLLSRHLPHLDEGKRLKYLIAALPLPKRIARYTAEFILFSRTPSFIR